MNKKEIENLHNLTLRDYFFEMDKLLLTCQDIEVLSNIFTKVKFETSKPYLYWRILVPVDKRFESIILIYDDSKKLKALRWNFKILLEELKSHWGEPSINYIPSAESTFFMFKSKYTDKHEYITSIAGCYTENSLEDFGFEYIQINLY